MDVFEGLLHELHSSCEDSFKVDVIICKISNYFRKSQNDCSTDLLIFLIFGENGLTSFINKILRSEVHKSNILSIFSLLEFLLVNYEKFCIPYAEEVKKLCLWVVNCDIPAKIKENALKLLKCVFSPSFIVTLDLSNIMNAITNLRDNLPPSVQGQLFSVTGIIFEKMPEISENVNDFLNYFLKKIKGNRKSSVSMISGCLDGINGYLVNFAPNSEQISDIYSYLKEFCSPKPRNKDFSHRETRRAAERSALRIVNRHYRVFAEYIYKDIECWHKTLNFWLEKGKEDRHLGFGALVAVYKSVAYIHNSPERNISSINLESIVSKLLNSQGNFNVASTIGLVELISTGHIREELASRVLQLVTKRLSARNDSYMYLSLNLECVSKYLTKSNTVKADYLIQIQRMAVALIDDYPKTESNFKRFTLEALEKSFYYVERCGPHELDEYVKEVIYQGLIRSCSYQIYNYTEMQKEIAGKELISHKSFLPLWIHITNLGSSNTDLEYFDSKNTISNKVLDEYISSFLKVNKKLDLRFHVKNPCVSNAETTAEAFRPNDWQIFINNVNLFVDVMEEADDLHRMKKWLMRIMSEAIDSVYRVPMISDYYKIIIVCLKIADKIHFFDECTTNERIIQRFLWNISQRVGQYKGDTQIYCFQTLLAAPVRLIEPFMKDVVPIFKLIVQLSSGHFPLLEECVSTLERWFKCSPKEDMEFLLRSILPYFDVFLQSKSEAQPVSHVYLSDSERKPLKVSGQMSNLYGRNADSKLLYIQKKFLLFLGRLNTDISKHLIENEGEEDSEEDEEYEWVKSLTYDIPLSDINLRIRVKFLPRVIELALSSGDRYTRIRACEFLHSAVTLTLGNMKKMNGQLNGLFRKLVPLCLLLACDSDTKILQIYELLMTQMIHYFADRDRNISETEIFIKCLMESVSHLSNSTLRDLAARLIREFVEWSLKSVTSTGEICSNVKLILKSMYSLSIHPNYNNRRGAAIVFNNIYSLIKDETDLLNTNWFLFYYYFMEGLSMCSWLDDTSHITNAIELIKTSLRGKDLNICPKVPPGFNDNFLNSPAAWIFTRCSHHNEKIRKLSMSVIEDFSKGSVKEFIKVHVSEIYRNKEYISVVQGEGDDNTWLSYCSSVFDYYNWLLIHDAVKEADLKNAGLEELLGLFLDKLPVNHNILDATTCLKSLSILHMLEFFTTSINRNIILYNQKIMELLKICIYKPGKFKFEVCDHESREKLVSILKVLIPKLFSVLKDDVIKHLLSADEYFSSVQNLGECLQNREPLWEMVDLLNGLKMLYDLKLWDAGIKENISGNEILRLVFNSIFTQRLRRCSGFLIEEHDRVFLADYIKFGIEIGVSMDVIIDLLRNEEEVIQEETFNKTTKGEYFMNMFKDELFDYFIRNSDIAVDEIMFQFPNSALITIFNTLNHINRTNLSFGYKKKFIFELCRRWAKLEELSDGSKILLLSIVRSMCQVIPEVLIEEHSVRNWFFDAVANTKASEEMEIIFDLCPYVSPINEDFNERLTNILDQIFKNLGFFTAESDTPDPKVVIACNGLINSFVRTRSLSVLQGMIRILKKYKKLQKENEIEKIAANICQSSIHKIPDEHLKKILYFLHGQLFSTDGTSEEVYECFILKLLQKSDSEFVWNYLLEILDDLLRTLKGQNLVHKISALKIMQVCFVKAKREELENVSDEKKEAFRNCISICSKIPSTEESEPLRKYVCCCFNTLCTVISVKSNDQKLYKSLIFKDDFPFLSRMICQKKKWILRMDFDEIPKRRKVLIALRRSITKERQMKLGKTVSSIQYLQEETLFASSLNDDVMRFDCFNWIIRPGSYSLPKRDAGEHHLELEMDEINNHECMPTLIGLIRHMVEEGITPMDPRSPPFWLSSLMNRMTSLNSSENEKIFLLKVMCNAEEYIKPYSEFIVSDILHTLLEVFQEKPINYLIMDVISMVLGWNLDWNVLNRRLQASFTQLAIYIIKKSDAYRKDIIKSNLEIAKLLIETCKDNMNLSILSIHAFNALETGAKFRDQDKNMLSYLNLQFCGILLANLIPAWTQNKEEDFIRMVLGYFGEEKNGKFAAEVCGLSLKYLKSNNFKDLEKLTEMTREKIQYVKSKQSVKDLPLIYAIYKNFPEICSNFVAALRNSAWSLRGQFRVQSLEMLLSHLKAVTCYDQSVFGSTIYGFLLDMLSPDDFEALSVSLQMVEVFLDKAVDSKANDVFEKALTFGDYKISRVRRSVYNIASTIFEKWDERYSNKFSENIKRMCKIVLIKGMNDKEPDLSEKCLEFWYLRTSGSKSSTRFAKILCELYTPETEKGFFNFAAKLMIRSAVQEPGYEKCIFEHPLVLNSTFKKKIISTTAYFSATAPSFSIALSGSLHQSSLLGQENEDGFEGEETNSGISKQRRRFVNDAKKVQKYFAKKKTALEEELERKKAVSSNDINLLREYKDGDFPFIQITHFDVLKPLEELTMKDPQIGRYFITSLYDGFAVNITDDVREMIVKIGELVRQVFEENSSSDPAIVAFFFYVLMHCSSHVKTDSDTISKVAKSSGWFSVGGLLIEDLIISRAVEPPVIRRKGVTEEEKAWFNLAELTRCLKEFEVLRGILIDKLRVGINTSEAIRYESVSDWFNAASFYESALNQGESLLNDFCVNAYLNSLARLSEWKKLNTYIRNTYDINDLWSNASLFEKVLPWFMKSTAIQCETAGMMFEIISEIQQDPKKGIDLKKYFVEELTVSHFLNGKSQWAEYYLHQMCLNFLSNWSHWNKWSNNFRFSKLIEFQLISEVDQCLKVLKEKSNMEVSRVADLWSKNGPKESDDLMNWDLKLTLRNYFLSKLRNSCPDLDWQQIRKSVVISELDLVKSGIVQKNVQISEKYLNHIKQDLKLHNEHELQLMHNYYRNCLELLKAEVHEKDENIRLKRIVDASSRLQIQMTSMMDTQYDSCNVFFYECNMKLSKVMYLLRSYKEESLGYAATVLDIPRGKIKENINEKELEYLQSARKVMEGVNEKLLSETYIQIVKYHRRQVGYNRQLAKCLFRSMSLGNIEARQLFCCLLNEVKLAKDWASDQEIRSSFETVPVWMFLKWMNQLLANLDSEMFPFLKDVIYSLAEEYPNSMRYAFELSKNSFKYNHEYGGECRSFVDILTEKLLSDVHHRNFLTGLSFVVAPDLVLKYDINKLATEIKLSCPNWNYVTGMVQDLYERIYGEELKRFRGPVFDCLTKIKHDIKLLLSLGQEPSLWHEKLRNIVKCMPQCNLDDNLKQYSPWLYNFHATNQDIRIELPGQYTGDQKPILKQHAFISSFRRRVLVMNSKCKPIRISILGDNAREYRFLVKFGEDLRQDQRIQQAFGHMNYVLRENQKTSPYFIDTYEVIPLKSNLGIIEWVSNTVSLYEMITGRNPSIRKTMEMVQRKHLEFLAQDNNVNNVAVAYLNGFKRINRDNSIARFTERIYSFEWDLLRKAFWNLSTYPEQFAYLRKNFATSEAVIFVAHWVIGIGDRHLDNTLISTRTGRALGIDFGCAFGFATEFLTPPELIPFRLTPQIISLMKPLGTSGLIKESMIHCLKAFCREKSMLLATLEVFASEPALDWLEKARRDGTFTNNPEWSPWKKIAMVKEKLEGANPVKIFSDDLKSGHPDSECLEEYLEVLRGDGSRCRESSLTEEKQVECLIDLASDYHVLSKTYVGWNPWL